MKQSFLARRSRFWGLPNGLLILMMVFFLVPFGLRGARYSLEQMENKISDWLPSDFDETKQLEWFGEHFLGEQFVVLTWEGCTEEDPSFRLLVEKLKAEVSPDPRHVKEPVVLDGQGLSVAKREERLRARKLGDKLGLDVAASDFRGWADQDEKWLKGSDNGWYYLTPEGELYRWNGKSNLFGFLGRAFKRSVLGDLTPNGTYVDQFGERQPGKDQHNDFHDDIRRLSARYFSSVRTGPEVVEELAGEGGPLRLRGASDLSPEDRERMAREAAIDRLTGTLFAPALPPGFDWSSKSFETRVPADRLAVLPTDWKQQLETFVAQVVQQEYAGDRKRFVAATDLIQARHWRAFFASLSDRFEEQLNQLQPPQVGFAWTAEAFRARLSAARFQALPANWEEQLDRFVENVAKQQYNGQRDQLVTADDVAQARHWQELLVDLDEEFSPPPRQTCILVTFSEAGERDLRRVMGRGLMGKPPGKLVQLAKDSGVLPPPLPPTTPWGKEARPGGNVLRMGGPPVDNVAIDEEGEITLVRLVGFSLLVGLGISYLCFRSIKITALLFFVGGVGAIFSLAIVWFCGGRLDSVLLTMPSLVYVLGLSGAVHIVNYYRDAVRDHGLPGAPERALMHGLAPCALAAFTTSLGLVSLCQSNILPINKFGFYSALGVLATAVLLFTYLPAALQVWPPKQPAPKKSGKTGPGWLQAAVVAFWNRVGIYVSKRYGWVIVSCSVLLVVAGMGLFKITTSVQLLKLFDDEAKVIRDYAWLEENFGKLVPMEMVVQVPTASQTPSVETVRNRESVSDQQRNAEKYQYTFLERVELVDQIQRTVEEVFGPTGKDIIGHSMSAVTFTPDLPPAAARTQRYTANSLLERNRDRLLQEDYLSIGLAQGVAPEVAGKTTPDSELWRIGLRLGALNDVDYGQFFHQLKTVVEPILAAYRFRDSFLQNLEHQVIVTADEEASAYRSPSVFFEGNKILVLGADPHRPLSEMIADQEDSQLLRRLQLTIFARTLNELLLVKGFSNSQRLPHPLIWVDADNAQHQELLTRMTAENWDRYLQSFNQVIVLADQQFKLKGDQSFQSASISKMETQTIHHLPGTAGSVIDWETLGKSRAEPREKVLPSQGLNVVYTGVVPIIYKAQRTLLTSLIESIGWAFVMIAGVMMILLRSGKLSAGNLLSIRGGMLSMFPNVFPVVVIFGIMGHMKIMVDIGSMMTASVAMGVAVDDTIHFLTWFRGGVLQGKTRREAIMLAYDRCAGAMTQTTLIGGLGLSVFAFSTFTPTQRFGVMMLTLLGAALVGDLIFLPAILASPLGKCFCPKPSKGSKSKAATEPVQDPVESVLETSTESGSTPHGGMRSKQGEPLHLRRDKGHRGPPS